MQKDRIINGGIAKAVAAIKSNGAYKLTKVDNSILSEMVEVILTHQIECVKDEMLNGEIRAVIPKIGSFTKNPKKAIYFEIQNNVLQKHGFSNWHDIPKDLKYGIKSEIDKEATLKFRSIKRAKRNKAIDMAKEIQSYINKL